MAISVSCRNNHQAVLHKIIILHCVLSRTAFTTTQCNDCVTALRSKINWRRGYLSVTSPFESSPHYRALPVSVTCTAWCSKRCLTFGYCALFIFKLRLVVLFAVLRLFTSSVVVRCDFIITRGTLLSTVGACYGCSCDRRTTMRWHSVVNKDSLLPFIVLLFRSSAVRGLFIHLLTYPWMGSPRFSFTSCS